MPDADAVRRLALAHPEAVDASARGGLSFTVDGRGFAWTYMRRLQPKKPRLPDLEVLAIRCDMAKKELLIEAAPEVFFDDAHYRGFPAVLTRLAVIDEAELAALLEAAWRLQAPKRLGGLGGTRRCRRQLATVTSCRSARRRCRPSGSWWSCRRRGRRS
jgi:hypothetical protein